MVIFLIIGEAGSLFLPMTYTVSTLSNYSSVPYAVVCYAAVVVYPVMCAVLLIQNWKRQFPQSERQEEERTSHALTRYLREHLAEDLNLSVLGEAFLLNPQYISQLFKSKIGVNFFAYLTNIRMEKAKELLTTPCPIGEISEKCGYGDYRVFTKVFKKNKGVTPSQYRLELLEKVREDKI